MIKYFENILNKMKKSYSYAKLNRKKTKEMNNIINSKWYFYYDETGNFGKIRLNISKKRGFNVDPTEAPFVLGGIWSKEEISNKIAYELMSKYQKNLQNIDIKFRGIFGKKCSFDRIICSKKLDYILDWMEKYNVYLHFTEHHIMHDITCDLYDSLPGKQMSDERDIFRIILIKYVKKISVLLEKHHYPFVESPIAFWNEFLENIPLKKYINNKIEPESIEALPKIYKQNIIRRIYNKLCLAAERGSKINSIYSGEVGTLTDNLYADYRLSTIIFRNSWHYFDNENVIKELFDKDQVGINHNKNYSFINVVENGRMASEESYAVYIADWIVGILQQIIVYLREHGQESFYPFIKSLSNEEKQRFIRLCKIIRKSKEENPWAFRFYDGLGIEYRFEWLINFEETIIRANLV